MSPPEEQELQNFTMGRDSGNSLTVTVLVNVPELCIEIDTGVSVSIVSDSTKR